MSLLVCKNQSLVKSVHLISVQETGIPNGRSVKSLIKIDERGSRMACIAAAAGGVAATLIFTGAVSWPAGILIGGVLFISTNVCGRPTVVLPDIKPVELSRRNFNYTEVKMDELGISQKEDEILCTRHLSACVAIGVGHKFDRITRIFKERRMAHILGGDLYANRAVTEGLFNGLNQDAMFVVAFGWLYEMNTKQDKAVIDQISKYCLRNSVPYNLRKTQWVYTSYAGIDDQKALLGSIQLFPNGDISSLDGRGIDREKFYFEIGAEDLRRTFSECF